MVVHVGIAERAAGDGIATDADGGDGADGVEDFEEEAFVDFGEEVAYVERGGMEGGGGGGSSSSGVAVVVVGGRGGCGCGSGSGGSRCGGGFRSGGGGGSFFGFGGSRHGVQLLLLLFQISKIDNDDDGRINNRG